MVLGLACGRCQDAIAGALQRSLTITFGSKHRQLVLFEHPTVKYRTVARYAMALSRL
jgi:hypothetical protein